MSKKSIGDLIEIKMTRRGFVAGASALFASTMIPTKASGFKFRPKSENLQLNKLDYPYKIDTLIRWGDQIISGENNALNQFGYNNDYIAYMPIDGSKRGLLCVNHETVASRMMYPKDSLSKVEIIRREMQSIGHSVVEVYQKDGKWHYENDSKYNRRINAFNTVFDVSGPAADKIGKTAIGTVNNCGGGKTPWNTILSCEENFNGYFYGKDERYGINKKQIFAAWNEYDKRFEDMDEANKFGWVWELDPFDPTSKPAKRTALGRFKHESATCVKSGDNVVVYMGDDDYFEHLYKYIGKDLDSGTLYVAQFDENKVKWLPIPKDKLIKTRQAASALDATTMDRPEDIDIDHNTKEVYVAMTSNRKRKDTNVANPRIKNHHGHIIKLTPNEHTDLEHEWDMFMLADGDISCPDNLCFQDNKLWIATDGMNGTVNQNDGLFVVDDLKKPVAKRVLSVPNGAEATGPEFTPDGKTMFLSIQHPGEFSSFENPTTRWPDFEEGVPPKPSVIAISL